jgi:hypothetical protein
MLYIYLHIEYIFLSIYMRMYICVYVCACGCVCVRGHSINSLTKSIYVLYALYALL